MGMSKKTLCQLVCLIFLFCIGLWTIDIGVSGIVTGQVGVTTLIGVRNPATQYHVGLIITIVSFMLLIFLLIKNSGEG